MLRVYLVRHGETDWNVEGRLQGSQDTPLNTRGLEQAERIADRLAHEGGFLALYSSPLSRAWQTAQVICRTTGLEPIPDERLRERSLGLAEGLTGAELDERFPQGLEGSGGDLARLSFPGEETRETFAVRASAFFRDLQGRHSDGKVAVVTHGGAIVLIIAQLMHLDLGRPLPFWIDNGSISQVEFGGPIDRVLTLNDSCHLSSPASHGELEQSVALDTRSAGSGSGLQQAMVS